MTTIQPQVPVPPDPRNFQQVRDAFGAIIRAVGELLKIRHTSGAVMTITGAGAPSITAPNGTMYVDTTNHRLYVRSGGAWKYATLT